MWGEMSSPIPLAVAGGGMTVVATRDLASSGSASSGKSFLEKLGVIVLPSVLLLIVSIALQIYLHRRSRKETAAATGAVPVVAQTPSPAAEQPAIPVARAVTAPPAEVPSPGKAAPPAPKETAAPGSPPEAPLPFEEKTKAKDFAPALFSDVMRRFPGKLLPEGMDKARLVFEDAEAGRKTLILVKPRLAVGVNKFTRDPKVDLTLRLLPCRSQEQDPENWKRNLLISSPHFTIEARESAFLIRDEMDNKNGTALAELKGGDDEFDESVTDADTVFQTASMMETLKEVTLGGGSPKEGQTTGLPKRKWTPLPERCSISIGKRAMVLHAQTFISSHWNLYALRLKRVENCPGIEYVQLIRRAYIGSDPNCPIRILDPSFPRLAAAIDFNKGRYFLATGQAESRVLLNGKELGKSTAAPLTHVSLIEIGNYRWRFEPATIDDFTETD